MNEKIIERCKTCEKQCMQEDLQQIEKLPKSYRAEANLDGLNSYRASIKQTESFSMDQEFVENLLRLR